MKTKVATISAFIFTALGLIVMLYFSFNKQFNDGSGIISTTLANEFGSFIGGIVGPIFSLSAFLLVYATLVEQQKTFQLQKFEGRLFEILRYHRENVNLMKMRVPSQKEMTIEGYRCFIEMKKQFEEIFQVANNFDKEKKIPENQKIKLSYSILYYGVGLATIATLKETIKDIDTDYSNKVIEKCREKKSEYDSNTVYHGGNQSRLGHYFRNISQIIQYIDNTIFLTTKDKYEYAKMLRSQFSQYELAIFFYNTFSEGGKPWTKYGWVKTYKLIKNIPENFLGSINPKNYFDIKYEHEE
jgi:hypothetical protein